MSGCDAEAAKPPAEDQGHLRRLALIGPVLPFRGGIAQHTTMLHRAAYGMTDLRTISFRRMYPAWLFPGQSDRDPAHIDHREEGVDYLIDSLNPLTWRSALKRVVEHRPEVVIIPWWTIYWAICFGYLAKRLHAAGIPVVLLCHNAVEHESAAWRLTLARRVFRQADGFLVQSRVDQESLKADFPQAAVSFHPHPLYHQFPEPSTQLPRRAARELLFYGFVRPYKGLDILIEAMALLNNREHFFLTVAGEFWQGREDILRRIDTLGLADRIEIIDRYLDDQETADLFQRADLVVLPYRSATGSGVIPLAYHYDTPVVATRVGGLPDMVLPEETGFLIAPENPHELAATLDTCVAKELTALKPHINAFKKTLSWESLVDSLLACVEPTAHEQQPVVSQQIEE